MAAMTTTLEERPAYPVGRSSRRTSRAAGRLGALTRAIPWPICVVAALGAALRLAHVEDVAPNQFYDAAVRSMSISWHNFFFGAFDPAGILSVDKPPLDLWLQVASVKVFGWGEFSLRLPEVIGGTLSIPVLYDAVRRVAGRPAGLASALTLAVLPESVLTSRSDTMDSLMMLCVVGALWLAIRACSDNGRLAGRMGIVLAAVALGVGFNVKLLEALVAAPALVVLYLLASSRKRRQKLLDLAAAAAALIVVSLAWALPASIASGSPWPVGSSDGTIWNAIFVFNGFQKASQTASTKPGGPGPFRLLVATDWQYDLLFGCVLVAAVAIGVAVLVRQGSGRRSLRRRRQMGRGLSLQSAFALALAVWIAVAVIVFDTIATLHARYLEALAPAVAVAIGWGATALAGLAGRSARKPSLIAVSLVLACVAGYTFALPPYSIAWATCALIIAAIGAVLLARAGEGHPLFTGARWLLAGVIVAGILLFPVHETARLVGSNANDSLGLATAPAQNISALSEYPGAADLECPLRAGSG